MIRHILKIIWTERKINLWILLELILVFCTLWFCVDYLYFITKRYFESRGFDIEHVYQIHMDIKHGMPENNDPDAPEIDIWTVFDRIKAYPGVENASMSIQSIPYSGGWSSSPTFMNDSIPTVTRIERVSPEFFDVFRIDILHGKAFTWDNVVGEKVAMISDGNGNAQTKEWEGRSFRDGGFGMPVEKVQFFYEEDQLSSESKVRVIGVAEKTKRSEYHDYMPVVYYPLKKDEGGLEYDGEICVRLKPEADHDFINRFREDMSNQLEIGKFYLNAVESLQDKRDDFVKWTEFEDNINSMYAILTFVVINIFLAVIGTFWFRTRSRRNEIGIRMAHGASKMSIKSMFSIETLLLLVIASVIGAILCINISMINILTEMELPVAQRENPATGTDHLIDYAITFLILSVISFVAVLYPATRASKTQPAAALKSE